MDNEGSKLTTARKKLTPQQRKLVISGSMLLLSFLSGGLTYKILRDAHELLSGDAFFATVMGIGFITILVAGGLLVVLKQRALNNTVWFIAATLGLSLIMLATGYFEAYTW